MFDSNSDHNRPMAYFITEDFNADHVQQLVQAFDKSSVPYILQKETDTLGQPLDKRYFVVVDNIKGQVVLGPQFSSLLMFIVGYPRKGSNKKNHYCKKAQDVILKYKYFRTLPQLQKTTFKTSVIKSKSQLKTIKSIPRSRQSSTILHQRSQSVSQKSIQPSIKPRSLAEINEKSKVFMLKVINEQNQQSLIEYNKCINKVAANNPSKCKIVSNFQQLKDLLEVESYKHNQLIINQKNETDLEDQDYKQFQKLIIMVFKPAHYNQVKKPSKMNKPRKNNKSTNFHIKYCNSLEDIFQYVHALGNQSKPQILPTNNQVSILKTQPEKKLQKTKTKKIIWAKTQSQIQSNENTQLQVAMPDQIKYINSQNQIGQFIPRLQNSKKISFTQHDIGQIKRRRSQQEDIETLISQPYRMNIQQQKKSISSKSIPKLNVYINEVPIVKQLPQVTRNQEYLLTAQSNSKKIIRNTSIQTGNIPITCAQKVLIQNNSPVTPAPKSVIRKIKRVKSDYNKSIKDSSLQNEQLYSQYGRVQSNQKNQQANKYVKRRMIIPLMPQQYCNPISPASQQSSVHQQQKVINRVIYRTLRCRSQQPQIRYVNENQINGIKEGSNQKIHMIKRIVRIPPINDGSQRSIHPTGTYLRLNYPQYASSSNKKQDILRSTTSTQNDYHMLFLESKNSNSDHQLVKANYQSRTPYTLGTFGNITKPNQHKEYVTSIIEQNPSKVIQNHNRNSYNKILNTFASAKQSKMSLAPQTVSFCSLKNPQIQQNIKKTIKKSIVRKKLVQPACIIWKQFNYQIKQQIKHMEDQIASSNVRSYSFYLLQQLDKIIKCLPHLCKIIIFMDDGEVEKYLKYLGKIVRNFDTLSIGQNKYQIVSVYLYPKSAQSLIRMKSLRRPEIVQTLQIPEQLKKKIKIILSNDYYSNKKQISKEIFDCFVSAATEDEVQQSVSYSSNSQK